MAKEVVHNTLILFLISFHLLVYPKVNADCFWVLINIKGRIILSANYPLALLDLKLNALSSVHLSLEMHCSYLCSGFSLL